jgi:hypothetical protein
MRRIVPLVALIAALLAGASSASAMMTAHTVCGSACGSLEVEHASGALTMAAKGVAWGQLGHGVIVLLDRSNPGGRDWSVSGAKGTRVPGTNWWRYSGRNLHVSTYGSWTMRIRKSGGVYLSVVAEGWVRLPRLGSFTLNHHWVRGGARYTLHS